MKTKEYKTYRGAANGVVISRNSGKFARLADIGGNRWFVVVGSRKEGAEIEKEVRRLEAPLVAKIKEKEIVSKKKQVSMREHDKRIRALTKQEILELWEKRKNLSETETVALRLIVREIKGIDKDFRHGLLVCPECAQVGANCTCRGSRI